MNSKKTLPWDWIVEYKNERVNTGTDYFRKTFELYVCRNGQIAWSPYKDSPHINPQNGVFTGNVTPEDIGKLLGEMAKFELKTEPVDPMRMVRENADLVNRILLDFQRHNQGLQR